jgi:hypothetical protein
MAVARNFLEGMINALETVGEHNGRVAKRRR